MTNITFSVDEKTTQPAREAAQTIGKSLNRVVRDYLQQLACNERIQQECDEFVARGSGGSGGRLNGWKFDRDEANARR